MPARNQMVLVALCTVIAAVFIAIFLGMPSRAFYSPDEGVKFLQMQGMDTPFGPSHLLYPGRSKDPALTYYPSRAELTVYYARIFPFVNEAGRVQTNWLPWFPFLTKLVHGVLGMRGVYVIPLLFGLIALWLTGAIAAILEPPARGIALLFFGLSSPLLFYSITFWEHTLSLTLQLLSLLVLLPVVTSNEAPRPTASLRLCAVATLLVCSIALRREAMFFAAALGIALVLQVGPARLRKLSRRQVRILIVACGALLFLLMLSPWILPQRTSLDLYVSLYRLTLPETWLFLDTHFFNVFLLLKEDGPLPTILRWCGQAGLLICIVNGFWPGARRLSVFMAGSILLLAPALVLAVVPDRYRALHSVFLSAPLVSLALLPVPHSGPRPAAERLIRSTALLFAVLYFLGTWPTHRTHGGLEWGSRYAFVLFSLMLAIGSANGLRWMRSDAARGGARLAVQLLVALMMLTGSLSVARGVRELNITRRDLGLIQDALAVKPAPIVTDCWWMGAGLADLFTRHEIYTLASPDELHEWLSTVGTNYAEFVYASYKPIAETAQAREKNRIAAVGSEVVCGMSLSTYRIVPRAP